ncbi:MAG: 50S ribosomal protein L22 [Actinomycetota bacterium]|nr:MAG: 50S ribosomal protein L22 [Actinomycetota bacterium]
MTAVKTNERPGTRAVLSSYHASAYKFREVLNLIRGRDIKTAREILAGLEREVASVIGKLLDSAVANAVNNDRISEDELFVASCYADEGPTMKRFRARARGRAGALRKRTAHVTVIVARMEDDQLKVVRSKRDAEEANRRARRVARTRGNAAAKKVVAGNDQPESVKAVEAETVAEIAEPSPEVEMPVVEADQVEETDAVETEASRGGQDAPEAAEVADEAAESTESQEEEN